MYDEHCVETVGVMGGKVLHVHNPDEAEAFEGT